VGNVDDERDDPASHALVHLAAVDVAQHRRVAVERARIIVPAHSSRAAARPLSRVTERREAVAHLPDVEISHSSSRSIGEFTPDASHCLAVPRSAARCLPLRIRVRTREIK